MACQQSLPKIAKRVSTLHSNRERKACMIMLSYISRNENLRVNFFLEAAEGKSKGIRVF